MCWAVTLALDNDAITKPDYRENTFYVLETTSGNQRSELEILAEQRDYKRRRQSYRAKNVHITKRTPIEVCN